MFNGKGLHVRALLLVLSLLAAAPAIADPAPACWPRVPGSTAYAEQLHFYPTDNLDTFWRNRDGTAYAIASWWCLGKYDNTVAIYTANRADLPAMQEMLGVVASLPTLTREQLLALHAKYTTKQLSDSRRAKAWVTLLANKPAAPLWAIAKNGTTYDRPVFPVVDGVRGLTYVKGYRYTVGAPCACNLLALEEGKSVYCPLALQPVDLAKVALCSASL
jgi:hypothetical protein